MNSHLERIDLAIDGYVGVEAFDRSDAPEADGVELNFVLDPRLVGPTGGEELESANLEILDIVGVIGAGIGVAELGSETELHLKAVVAELEAFVIDPIRSVGLFPPRLGRDEGQCQAHQESPDC